MRQAKENRRGLFALLHLHVLRVEGVAAQKDEPGLLVSQKDEPGLLVSSTVHIHRHW